jgi:hypothetical protein
VSLGRSWPLWNRILDEWKNRVRGFATPAAPRDKTVDWQPPNLADDYMARLLPLLVEQLGGEPALTPDELRGASDRLILVRVDDSLSIETRRLATEQPGASDIPQR